MFGVHPDVSKGFAGACFGLGDFIFVVGEHVVDAPDVDIDGISQQFRCHSGAFDVPTRTSPAEGAFPKNITIALWIDRFPQDKIGNIVFVVLVGNDSFGSTRFKFIEIQMREASIVGKLSYGIINASVAPFISDSFLHELFESWKSSQGYIQWQQDIFRRVRCVKFSSRQRRHR